MEGKTTGKQLLGSGNTEKGASTFSAAISENITGNSLVTTGGGLIDWKDVIKLSNAPMRDWLRAKGVDASGAMNRIDLVLLIWQNGDINSTINKLGDVQMPVNPRPNDILFSCKLVSAVQRVLTKPFINCSCFIEDLSLLAFGCEDGHVYLVSIADFLSPIYSSLHYEIEQLKYYWRQYPPDVSRIHGSTKVTQGKKHQL